MNMEEQLRALEKEMRGHIGTPELIPYADRLKAILATASEQAPVAWVFRSGHGTHFREGPEEPVKNVGWRPLFDSPAHTSEARDADFWAIERGCAALLGGATWAAMHPEDKRAYRDKLSAAMRQEAGE